MVLILSGCGGYASATLATGESASVQHLKPVVIEAGIVFSDRDGYFCFPVEQIGLSDTEEISSIVSSCDCVRPQVISYLSTSGKPSQAVWLTFEKEHPSNIGLGGAKSQAVPVNLGVTVELTTQQGSRREFTVQLLHTSPIESVQVPQ